MSDYIAQCQIRYDGNGSSDLSEWIDEIDGTDVVEVGGEIWFTLQDGSVEGITASLDTLKTHMRRSCGIFGVFTISANIFIETDDSYWYDSRQ